VDEIKIMEESHTRKQLLCKLLNVRAWKRNKPIRLEEIEDALAIEISDDADVVSEIEAVS